jgi:hypothetical protein
MTASQPLASLVHGVVVLLALSASALAQTVPPAAREISLAGPRVGFTVLSDETIARLAERDIKLRPLISQFGWQFERNIYGVGSDLTAVTEWVILLGGLEQGVALPSLSWMVGFRSANGAEFGVGPNISPSGTALAIAGGATFRAGALNFPVNFAVVPSGAGLRVSVLTGFNVRR